MKLKQILFLIMFLVLCVNSVSATTLTDDIVSYWKFDENTGTNASDSAGTNDGTIEGATWTTGKINSGLDFDGTNDYVLLPNTILSNANEISISMWVNTDIITGMEVLITLQGQYNINMYRGKVDDGDLFLLETYDGSTAKTVETGAILADTWYHVTGVYDGTDLIIYLDGTEVDRIASNTPSSNSVSSRIGSHRAGTSSFFFDGTIDEVGIWNRALTSSEITELYNSSAGLQYPFTTEEPSNPLLTFDNITANGETLTNNSFFNTSTIEFETFVLNENFENLTVAVGESGKLATSSDGTTWTQRTSSFETTDILGVAYSKKDDLWVVVGSSGKLATSPDGTTWTQRTSSFGTSAILDVAYSETDGLWVAVGESGKLDTSPDGITWTQRTSSFGSTSIYGVTYSETDGLWVAVGDNGKLATSPDGTTWTQPTSSFDTRSISSVAYSETDGLWVAVGESGKLATSSDGITWTQRTSSFETSSIWGVAYNENDGLWVAVGDSGLLATSPDGTTWTQRTSSFETTRIRGVTYSEQSDYFNQTYYLYNSTDDLINTSQFATNNDTRNFILSLSDNTYKISFFAENSKTNVTNQNYTFTIDTTPPTINNNIPLEINSYTLTLNSSCTDANLDYCNITINNQTIALNSTNVTFTQSGYYNYTITAEDLAGNIITEEGTILVNPYQYFYFIDQNSNPISNFSFNDINYENYARIKLFDYGYGNYSWEFSRFAYQSIPVNFTLNDTSELNLTTQVFFARIDLNLKDKTTGNIITGTNFTVQLISNIGEVAYTSNGTTSFQNVMFLPQQYRITVTNSDYFTEDIYFDFTNEEVITQNIFLTQINQSNAGIVIIEVVDGLGQSLPGAIVQALQWDSSTSSFIRVAEGLTGLDGKATINIILEDKIYKFQATREGNTVLSPQYRLLTTENGKTITLTLDSGAGIRNYFLQNLIYTATQVSYINNISTLKINWVNEKGIESELCFVSYRYRGLSQVKLNEYCDTGVAGEFIQAFNINTSQNIMIRAEYKEDGIYYPLKAFRYPSSSSMSGIINVSGLGMFVIPLFFMLALAFGILSQSLQIGAILIILSAGASLYMVPTLITGGIVAFLSFMSGLIIWGVIGGRK